jgi:hypothetical protein
LAFIVGLCHGWLEAGARIELYMNDGANVRFIYCNEFLMPTKIPTINASFLRGVPVAIA